MGKHSNEKPQEPEKEKPEEDSFFESLVADTKPKSVIATMQRPLFESECVKLVPFVNNMFKQQIDQLDLTKKMRVASIDGEIPFGTVCKHGGCSCSYDSPASNNTTCVYHPGVPIFHEGYKFWSCCQRKTCDFTTFMEQKGCESGNHKWIQDEPSKISCRWDWHQTSTNVVVAVYAKNYDYKRSFVKVNPIRLIVKLIFPLEQNAEFNIDLELRGIINVSQTSVKMFGTKVEITLPKAEGGQWVKLDFPRQQSGVEPQPTIINGKESNVEAKLPVEEKKAETEHVDSDSDVDLDDIELVKGATISDAPGELANYKLVEES